MMKIRYYMEALRLHTLPLALSSVFMGNFIALEHGTFRWTIAILAIVTGVMLQILSNVANDYGDSLSGVDSSGRIGPERVIATGKISSSEMKGLIYVFAFLSIAFGFGLIVSAGFSFLSVKFISFIALGAMAIWAAVKYTMGKNPYGYRGLGDFFVFVFFGIVATGGTVLLYGGDFDLAVLLPASAMGCFSTGVLTLNNMRDIENDAKFGKFTIVVKMGSGLARYYFLLLMLFAMVSMVVYGLFRFSDIVQWIFLPAFISIFWIVLFVFRQKNPRDLSPCLKQLVLSTFLFTLLFGLGTVLAI